MRKTATIILLIALGTLGCRKGPGPGGKGVIRGAVSEEIWLELPCGDPLAPCWQNDPPTCIPTWNQTLPSVGTDVYLIYGDDEFYSDKTETDINGNYEFTYLLKGNYKVFVYSDDDANPPPCCTCSRNKVRQISSVTLGTNKDEIEVNTFTVFEFDN